MGHSSPFWPDLPLVCQKRDVVTKQAENLGLPKTYFEIFFF